jgi:hypothetical protein
MERESMLQHVERETDFADEPFRMLPEAIDDVRHDDELGLVLDHELNA